jgi:hypothetical protein
MSKLKAKDPHFAHLRQVAVSPDAQSGCWIWTRSKTPLGYGYTTLNGRRVPAHRAMYMLANGVSLETKQFVCHKCDNPSCVNPDHMFVGSQGDNMRDMVAKGRNVAKTKPHVFPRGSASHRSKLTDEQVAELRAMFAMGIGPSAIHRTGRFPITREGISRIKNNRSRRII